MTTLSVPVSILAKLQTFAAERRVQEGRRVVLWKIVAEALDARERERED